MQIQIFNVPLIDAGESLAEMNRFLAGHKVLEVATLLIIIYYQLNLLSLNNRGFIQPDIGFPYIKSNFTNAIYDFLK